MLQNTSECNQRSIPLKLNELPEPMWSMNVNIHFSHCDPSGIVYTPNFFDIFNNVIETWYKECLNIDYLELIGKRDVGLGYAKAAAEFFSPVMMGDLLTIFVYVERVGNKSLSLTLHAMKDGREALRGSLVTVVTSLADNHKSAEIPADLKATLLTYESRVKN